MQVVYDNLLLFVRSFWRSKSKKTTERMHKIHITLHYITVQLREGGLQSVGRLGSTVHEQWDLLKYMDIISIKWQEQCNQVTVIKSNKITGKKNDSDPGHRSDSKEHQADS